MQPAGRCRRTTVTEILKPVADALDYAHARGVIHRDIKPSNILLSREGTPILADFGLARMIAPDREVTTAGMVLGTPNYMAPEQARGLPEPASDQYALAVVAYEMVTGRVPYSAPTPMGVVIAHQTGPLPPPRSVNPDIPEDVEAALVKALEREPEQRFASATGFLRALAQDTPSGRVVAPPASPPTPPAALPPAPPTALPPAAPVVAGGGGRRRWLLAGGAVLLLVAVIAGVARLRPDPRRDHRTRGPRLPKTVTGAGKPDPGHPRRPAHQHPGADDGPCPGQAVPAAAEPA